MLPALLAHNHEVVAYVRSTSTLSPEISSKINSIVEGSGTDSAAIKAAILSQNCDAVVNAAGLAPLTSFGKKGQLPEIFAAIVKAAVEARQERGGPPLRCWFLSGWDILDSPKQPHLIYDYVPLYPDHKKTYNLIKSYTPDNIAWSLFCASNLPPRYPDPKFPQPSDVSGDNLIAKADTPPAWKNSFRSWPLIGIYLNIMSQAQSYYTTMEDSVDFMATDLEKGLKSEWIGKRVGAKEKKKAN